MEAAAAVTRDLPRDQALGLRLLALARAAAGVHMAAAAVGDGGAGLAACAQERPEWAQVVRTQAAGLVRGAR